MSHSYFKLEVTVQFRKAKYLAQSHTASGGRLAPESSCPSCSTASLERPCPLLSSPLCTHGSFTQLPLGPMHWSCFLRAVFIHSLAFF